MKEDNIIVEDKPNNEQEEENKKIKNSEEDNLLDVDKKNENTDNTKEINEPLLTNNMDDKNNIQNESAKMNNNVNQNTNNNSIISDYIVKMQYTKLFKIPYFPFHQVTNIYFPCTKFNSEKIYLSQIQTPPFVIAKSGCKYILFYFIYI